MNYSQNLVIIVLDQREFKLVFGGIHCNGTWPRGAIQAVNVLPFDTSEVDRLLEGSNNAVVSVSCVGNFSKHNKLL